MLFGKKKINSIPTECVNMPVKTESSICTGETTVGFFNEKTGKLMYAELVNTEKDVINFYKKYGIKMEK